MSLAKAMRVVLGMVWFVLIVQCALAVQTTTVADTLYLANGQPAAGTVLISWPTFTTAAGEAVPAGNVTVLVDATGRLSVALAANAGATPAGAYYTAVMHLVGGPVTTEYWVVPATTTTSLSAIRSIVMPVTRAVPMGTVSTAGLVEKAGDTMQGPLVLSADPTADTQAATKHYVDSTVATAQGTAAQASAVAAQAQTTANAALPLAGGTMTGPITARGIRNRNDQFNMLDDCPPLGYTIPTDGATDAYAAIQGCIWAKMQTNTAADKRVPANANVNFNVMVLPRVCHGQYSCTDYTLSQQLDIPWNVLLEGRGGNQPTTLQFTGTTGGILLRGYAGIKALNLIGPSCFDDTNAATFLLPAGFGGTATDDGVQIGGNSMVENVSATCFGRHGFNWDSSIVPGTPAGLNLQSDETFGKFLYAAQNRGDGFHLTGGDGGVNSCMQCQARENQLYGAFDTALYASTFYEFLGDNNHSDRVPLASWTAFANTITGTACDGTKCVLSTATSGLTAGDLINLSGYSDAGLNTYFYVTAADASSVTIAYGVVETLGAQGAGKFSPGTHVWALAGTTNAGHNGAGGCVYGAQGTWIGPYCEGDQPQGPLVVGTGVSRKSSVRERDDGRRVGAGRAAQVERATDWVPAAVEGEFSWAGRAGVCGVGGSVLSGERCVRV